MYSQSGGGFSGVLRALLGTPTTPGMKIMATMLAIAACILFGPNVVGVIEAFLVPFLVKQYGADYYLPAYVALWLVIAPASRPR